MTERGADDFRDSITPPVDPGAPWSLAAELDIPANRAIADAVRGRRYYAHSDLTENLALVEESIDAAGVGRFSPAPSEYSYEVRYVDTRVVFLFVYGQTGLSFRLSRGDSQNAQSDGGILDPLLGEPWCTFTNPPSDVLEKWYLYAYKLAKQESEPHTLKNFDFNAALNAYSHAMGNSISALQNYLKTESITKDVQVVAEHIRSVQDQLIATVMDNAGEKGLTPQALEKLVASYAESQLPVLNIVGQHALLRWLVWMCWHEGFLRDIGGEREYIDPVILELVAERPAHNEELNDALKWLITEDPENESFVVVETMIGAPFVQFTGSNKDALIMDIPLASLKAPQRKDLAFFFKQGGLILEPESPSYVIWMGTNVGLAITLTDQIFRNAFRQKSMVQKIKRSDGVTTIRTESS